MATIIDSLLISIGLDSAPAKAGFEEVQKTAQETDQTFNSLATKWAATIQGLVSTVIAPVAGAFAIGSVINSYMSDISEVANMTGAYSKKLEEWRIKSAMLQRVTKEDLELYKKGREAIVNYKIAFADLSAKLSRSFMPVMNVLIEMLNKVTAWMNRNSDNIVRFIQVAAGVITAVFLPALIKMGAALLASPLTWIVAAIGALIVVIDDLVTYMQGGKSALSDFWSLFGTGEEISQALNDLFKKMVQILQVLWKPLALIAGGFAAFKTGAVLVRGAIGAFQALRTAMMALAANPLLVTLTAIVGAILWVKDAFERAGGDWSKVLDIMGQDVIDFLNIFGGFGDILAGFVAKFSDVFGSIREIFENTIKALYNGIMYFVSFFTGGTEEARSQFADGFLSAISGVADGFINLGKAIYQHISDALNAVLSAISGFVNSVIESILNIPSAIGDAFQTAWDAVMNFFSMLWEEFTKIPAKLAEIFDLSKILGNAKDKIKEAGSQVFNGVKSFFGFGGNEEEEKPAITENPDVQKALQSYEDVDKPEWQKKKEEEEEARIRNSKALSDPFNSEILDDMDEADAQEPKQSITENPDVQKALQSYEDVDKPEWQKKKEARKRNSNARSDPMGDARFSQIEEEEEEEEARIRNSKALSDPFNSEILDDMDEADAQEPAQNNDFKPLSELTNASNELQAQPVAMNGDIQAKEQANQTNNQNQTNNNQKTFNITINTKDDGKKISSAVVGAINKNDNGSMVTSSDNGVWG